MNRVLFLLAACLGCSCFFVGSVSADVEKKDNYVATEGQMHLQSAPRAGLFSFADIVEPLMPAVVNVYTTTAKQVSNRLGIPQEFREFFKDFDIISPFEEHYTQPKAVSLGSGFIIDASGYVVTNYHVIADADKVHIKLHDNTELEAKIVGSDQKTDLALLKVQYPKPLPHVSFVDDSKARPGDWVLAIGAPFGLGHSVTAGIISSIGRDIGSDGLVKNYIQTDAALNRGNSGGPLFDMQGGVIGVNTAIFSPSGASAGVSFAIPASLAKNVIDQIKAHGKVHRGILNITIQDVTQEIADALELKEQTGVLVTSVGKGGAGDAAGIKQGDVIISFNGKEVKNNKALQTMVAETAVGVPVELTIMRNGSKKTLKALLSDSSKQQTKNNHTIELNGVKFANISSDISAKLGVAGGVVVQSIEEKSKWPGMYVGDVIVSVNNKEIKNTDDLVNAYKISSASGRKSIVFLIRRGEMQVFLALPVR